MSGSINKTVKIGEVFTGKVIEADKAPGEGGNILSATLDLGGDKTLSVSFTHATEVEDAIFSAKASGGEISVQTKCEGQSSGHSVYSELIQD